MIPSPWASATASAASHSKQRCIAGTNASASEPPGPNAPAFTRLITISMNPAFGSRMNFGTVTERPVRLVSPMVRKTGSAKPKSGPDAGAARSSCQSSSGASGTYGG
jgi:hypothetical protein